MAHILSKEKIQKDLAVACLSLECFDTLDSTNTYLKKRAIHGAPHGAAAIADAQTAGRGRMGRTFQSPRGKGLYLSVLLRPSVSGEVLMRATGMAAVAAKRAVERVSGAKVQIKWTNDLVLNGKKLCGILAETVMMGAECALIVGVGVNVHHRREDFEGDVADMATSLAMEGCPVDRSDLAAALICELYRLSEALESGAEDYVEEYRCSCVTLQKDARLMWTESAERVFAEDIDDRFGLVVRRADGTKKVIRTGEVSVRGLYGYTE